MSESIRRRRRGDGSTHQTADGRWRTAITTPDEATGRRRRQYLSAPTERELLAKLNEARGARERGETTGRTPTLAAWSARWLVAKRLQDRPATWMNYRHALRKLEPALGSVELARLTIADVETTLASLVAGGLAPSTVGLIRVGLGACLSDAVRDGVINRNVARLARAPRVPATRRPMLGPADLRRLFEAVADEPIGPAVVLLGTTALRRGELLGLRWEDIDRKARTLEVRRQVTYPRAGYAYSEPKTRRSYRTVGCRPGRSPRSTSSPAGRSGPSWARSSIPMASTGRSALLPTRRDLPGCGCTTSDMARCRSRSPPASRRAMWPRCQATRRRC
jgi:integrase